MLGEAAQFGKPYPPHEDQQRQKVDTCKGSAKDSSNSTRYQLGSSSNRLVLNSAFHIPNTGRDGSVSVTTIKNYDRTIPSTSSVSRSRGITPTTNDSRQGMKQVQKTLRDKTSKTGYKGQMSDSDDEDDSTADPSSSDEDDAPNIDLVGKDLWHMK